MPAMSPQDSYPAFKGDRISLAEARRTGGGPVAGRYRAGRIEDESGSIEVRIRGPAPVPDGAWVSGRLEQGGSGWELLERIVHTVPRPGRAPGTDPARVRWLSENRTRLLRFIREYFEQEGFLEVETPQLVRCPAVEAQIHALEAGEGFLSTSPELHLKRILAGGNERIFEIARVFREEERGRRHLREFTMLEWYRAFGGTEHLVRDLEALVAGLSALFGRPVPARPFPRRSWRSLFVEAVGLDPFSFPDRGRACEAMARKARSCGFVPPGAGGSFEDLCEGLWAHEVEPRLGRMGALFVTEFPEWTAALARTRNSGGLTVAERLELYLDGIEIANGYHELNDPEANRRRLQACNEARRNAGRPPYPEDGGFFGALEAGMPPASGAALGLERLLMWLLGKDHISEVVFFAPP